jgi:hypothetical protein
MGQFPVGAFFFGVFDTFEALNMVIGAYWRMWWVVPFAET